MNLLGQEFIWSFMFSFIHKSYWVFQRFILQNFPNWVCQKVFRIHLTRKFADVFSFQQNVAFWQFLSVRCRAKSDNLSCIAPKPFSLSLSMHALFVSLLFSIWTFSHLDILTRIAKHSLTLWNITNSAAYAYFCVCFAFSSKWRLNTISTSLVWRSHFMTAKLFMSSVS